MSTPASFLVIALRRIGDVLLTTPLIHSIRSAHPDARIDALVFKGTGSILAGNPDLNTVHEIPHKLTFSGYRDFWQEHGRRYQWAISTQSGDRPTLLALLAGKQHLAPLTGENSKDWWRKHFLTRSIAPSDPGSHVVQRYLALGKALAIPPEAQLVAPAAPAFAVSETLGFDPAKQPFVVCHPMPMFTYKRWPDAQWRKLIERLLEAGFRVAISGGPGAEERAAIDGILGNLAGKVSNLAGRLSFAELAEVLKQATGYYGTDTSVTHLAAATGIPVTAIFGPTDPSIWGPWPAGFNGEQTPWQTRGPLQQVNNITIIQDSLPCVPCQLEGCDRHIHSHSQCLKNITADKLALPPHFPANA